MAKIGLDFDNTLVIYDNIFFETAKRQGLITEKIARNKVAIRNYLRQKGEEHKFTLLQGEVYGKGILEANPAIGMIEALSRLQEKGHELCIISHKTATPFEGPKYNLREAAIKWLTSNRFFDTDGLNMKLEDIFFESTKEEKIERIHQENCDYYVDDLPEILEKLTSRITKVLFCGQNGQNKSGDISTMHIISNWNELEYIVK